MDHASIVVDCPMRRRTALPDIPRSVTIRVDEESGLADSLEVSAPMTIRPATAKHDRLRSAGPPGIALNVGTAVAILLALDASSLESFSIAVLALTVSTAVAGIWLLRFAISGWTTGLRMPMARWIRWLAIPLAFAIAVGLTRTSIPSDVRFALSRGALDQAAAEIVAGGSTDRGWIGLYPAEHVERTANGMRFLIPGAGFIDQVGIAWSVTGEPVGVDGTDEYHALEGGWWTWISKFN